MQLAISRHPFDSRHLGAISLHGKHSAGLHRLAVEQHRTSAADGGFATDVRASESEHVAHIMDKQHSRLDFVMLSRAIDCEGDRLLHRSYLVWMLMDEKRNQCLACSLYNLPGRGDKGKREKKGKRQKVRANLSMVFAHSSSLA